MTYRINVCSFTSGTEALRGRALTYEVVKAQVLEAGRYSVFEATASARHARIFTRLERDPEVLCERETVGFPWVAVRPRAMRRPL